MAGSRRSRVRKRGADGKARSPEQLLHLVFGGELEGVDERAASPISPASTSSASIPNYRTAYDAWKAKAQATVDNARMRYFIVHLHRLLDPDATVPAPDGR